MRQREHYRGLTVKNENTGVKPADGKFTEDEKSLIVEMLDRQNLIMGQFRTWDLEKGVRWIMGYANFINQTQSGKPINPMVKKKIPKGTIVMVDFFGSFGNELTYDHPAIVIAESGYDLIVAPITSTPTLFGDANSNHIDLPKKTPNLANLTKDSVIKLEQLRYISKKRILYKKKRVTCASKLAEIDMAVMALVAPKTYAAMNMGTAKLKQSLQSEQEKNAKLQTTNETLLERISVLEAELEKEKQAVLKG